ncbi:uncharacterized protein TNCV_3893101 [Trichonephila clavipes]|nr:uncharacterized protein TNCV_3893101 [Trichonephila clavipes]
MGVKEGHTPLDPRFMPQHASLSPRVNKSLTFCPAKHRPTVFTASTRHSIQGKGRSCSGGHTDLTYFIPQILIKLSSDFYSQFGLAIHQNDHQTRRRFVEWAQNEIAVVPDFHKRILFSDEVHFWLNGYVNKQNCRIWSEANPQVYVETPLHPEKLTVWCALWAGGIIGPYFKNDEGHNVSQW